MFTDDGKRNMRNGLNGLAMIRFSLALISYQTMKPRLVQLSTTKACIGSCCRCSTSIRLTSSGLLASGSIARRFNP